MNVEEKFLQEACVYLRDWKRTPAFNDKFAYDKMMEIVNKSQKLKENITLEDIRFKLGYVCTFMNKDLKDIDEKDFIEYVKSDILSGKKYLFWFPIYNAFKFPNKIKLGFVNTFVFEDIDPIFQKAFISEWKRQYSINPGYLAEEKFLDYNKKCLFLSVAIEANGDFKASENASIIINKSVDLLRFLYRDDVPVLDFQRKREGSEMILGTMSHGTHQESWIYYYKGLATEVEVLTEIISKQNPTKIETKIRNTLNLFGTQTSIKNNAIRFILLIACLESLLLSRDDRDYIGWKLAEKTSFLVGAGGKNRMIINDYITQAYKKRSKFIHGDTKKTDDITQTDVDEMQMLITHVLNAIIKLRAKGFLQIKKSPKVKNINEYIEKIKFGLNRIE